MSDQLGNTIKDCLDERFTLHLETHGVGFHLEFDGPDGLHKFILSEETLETLHDAIHIANIEIEARENRREREQG